MICYIREEGQKAPNALSLWRRFVTLQEKRREWGRKYRARKQLMAQEALTKASSTPSTTTVVEADGTEHTYPFD